MPGGLHARLFYAFLSRHIRHGMAQHGTVAYVGSGVKEPFMPFDRQQLIRMHGLSVLSLLSVVSF